MPGSWRVRGLSGKRLVKRIWAEVLGEDVFGQAAKLSYFFLLALFPFLLVLTTLFGYFAHSADLQADLLDYFRRVVPRSAYGLVVNTLNQSTTGAGGGKLSIGIVFTLWAASNGMSAIPTGSTPPTMSETSAPGGSGG